jgi:hypothetical protein
MSKAFECISFVRFSLLFISVDLYTVYVHPYLHSNIITYDIPILSTHPLEYESVDYLSHSYDILYYVVAYIVI